jgi:putative phage-type endonuclease
MTAVRLGSDEWLAARREAVTGTDIPVLLGVSPWKSEATLADEKRGLVEPDPPNTAMRIGLAIEDGIRNEYEVETGRRLRHVRRLMRHPDYPWAAASLDFEVVGEKRIVEAKNTSHRPEDELPQAWEAQVRWQMGCAGYPVADIAALFGGRDLRIYTVEHDRALFDGLLDVAADFRRRLAEGGPFAHDIHSVKRAYPRDDGSEMAADDELAGAVEHLWALRGQRKALEEREDVLEAAIKTRMGPATALVGDGWRVTWKRTADRREVDWKGLAEVLLTQRPEPERAALVGAHEVIREGFRPFRISWKGGTE